MCKSAFSYNDGLAPAKWQATVVSNVIHSTGERKCMVIIIITEHTKLCTLDISRSQLSADHPIAYGARYGCSPWDQSVFRCHFVFNILLQSTATHQESRLIPSSLLTVYNLNKGLFLSKRHYVLYFHISTQLFTSLIRHIFKPPTQPPPPLTKMVVTSQAITFRVYSERQNYEQIPNIFYSAFMH